MVGKAKFKLKKINKEIKVLKMFFYKWNAEMILKNKKKNEKLIKVKNGIKKGQEETGC